MSVARYPVPVGAGGPPPVPDSNVTYKSVQVSFANEAIQPPVTGTRSLVAANVGAIRGIIHEGTVVDSPACKGFIDECVASDIFPIVCINNSGMTSAEWKAKITEVISQVPAGYYELANEPGATYDGGSNWSKVFQVVDDMSPIIRGTYGGRVCLGAALDTSTNTYLERARTRWGTNWPVDAAAIHPYGQQGSAATQSLRHNAGLTMVHSRLQQARSTSPARLPNTIPLVITEMGWGAGGNTNSTLVASRAPFSSTMNGAVAVGAGTVVLANGSGFPSSGKLFANVGGDFIIWSYAGRSGNSFTGCTAWEGTGTVPNGNAVSEYVVGPSTGTDGVAFNAAETEQALLLEHIYGGTPTTGDYALLSADVQAGLWARRNGLGSKTNVFPAGTQRDLFLKAITWFVWHDYSGHTPPPTGSVSWAEWAGLVREHAFDPPPPNHTFRPAHTDFVAEPATMALT